MEPLYLLHLKEIPVVKQLQIEEALLRADSRNWCIINQGAPPAIVLGISGKVSEHVCSEKMKRFPVPLIRRFSGGGTVFIDEETVFVTFICNTDFSEIAPYPQNIMRWTEQFYKPIFHPHVFQVNENDYVINDRKCGGNAQSICKNRWLHHSSILWDFSSISMDYLLFPKKTPAYRRNRPHHEFLCKIKEYWKEKNSFLFQIECQLNSQFPIKIMHLEEVNPILKRPHRQATKILS